MTYVLPPESDVELLAGPFEQDGDAGEFKLDHCTRNQSLIEILIQALVRGDDLLLKVREYRVHTSI